MRTLAIGITLAALVLASCSKLGTEEAQAVSTAATNQNAADSIYFGGDIVTVNDAQPTVEAVAIKNGRIVAVGSLSELTASSKGSGTKMIDLKGKTLLPGFIDPHSHFINGMAMEDQANVTAPPVGPASTAAEIVAELERFAKAEPGQIKYAQNLYAAAGVTTAQDGATMAPQVEVLKRAAARGELFIDVISYPFIGDLEKVLKVHPASSFGSYGKRLKLGGCKILADGSPQCKTAFFTTPYLTGGPGGEKDWKGEPTFPQETLNGMFKTCYDNGLQVIAHANGDAGIDAVLKGHEFGISGAADKERRTVIIHSQFVRKDQLQKYVDYKMIPSFYTEHTFFFGEAHIKNRGMEQASFISPMKTAIAMGLKPTNHTDFSVVPIDQMMVVWTAVNRKLRSGEVLGPDERISALDAIKAITINAAYEYFEEASKGSIEPGKLADLVILDNNPLKVDPDAIKGIKVVETIKEGKTIYSAL